MKDSILTDIQYLYVFLQKYFKIILSYEVKIQYIILFDNNKISLTLITNYYYIYFNMNDNF